MSSTGIDKVLIIKVQPGANRTLEDLIMKSLKHPHEIVWSSIKEDGMNLVRKGDYGLLIVSGKVTEAPLRKACRAAVNLPTVSIVFLSDETEFNSPEETDARKELIDILAEKSWIKDHAESGVFRK